MWPLIPDGIAPWWYYLCVGLSVTVMAISKAGFGGGIGILSIPLMALVMGSRHMLGVMLLVLVACDIVAMAFYLRDWHWPSLRWLLFGGLAGIAVGSGIFWQLRGMTPDSFNRLMNVTVGVLCLAIVVMQAIRLWKSGLGFRVWGTGDGPPQRPGSEPQTPNPTPNTPIFPAVGLGVGLVAGALSTLNHAAGPITTLYMLNQRLEKRKLVGTLLLYTLVGNAAKLPTFLLMPMPDGRPLINASTLHDSIWFIPLIPLGTLIGLWMHKKVPEKPFAAVMYIAAAATAVRMVYSAIW